MSLRNFKEWRLSEGKKARSQESELECPHKDPKFCREWNKFINGERDKDPALDPEFAHLRPKSSLGHFDRKSTSSPTRRNVARRKSVEGEGRYKWRDRGEY